jgi:hypothetical protein
MHDDWDKAALLDAVESVCWATSISSTQVLSKRYLYVERIIALLMIVVICIFNNVGLS